MRLISAPILAWVVAFVAVSEPAPGYRYARAAGRAAAAQVRVKPPDPPADLMAGLKSKDPLARRQAAEHLGEIRARGAIRALTVVISDGDSGVREAAAFALGMLADKSAAQALSDALDDAAPSVRAAAAAALGLLHDEAAVDELIDLMNDDSFDVRYDAVWALGRIGEPDAAEHLRAALAAASGRTTSEQLGEAFRQAVQNALEDIKAQSAASSGDAPGRPRRAAQAENQPQSHVGRGPAVRQSVLPAPTEEAIQSNMSGAVGLKVLVGTGGRAVRAYVTKRVGYGLDRRAVQAAMEYGYDAALRDGLVQTDWLDLQVRFSAR